MSVPSIVDRLVVEGLERIDARRGSADRISKALLRAHPELDNAGRVRVSRGLFGVRCHVARLTWQLTGVGLPHTAENLWAAYRATTLEEDAVHIANGLGRPGIRAPLTRLESVPWPREPRRAFATQHSLPFWVATEWLERWGPEGATAAARAMSQPGPITLRAARRHGGREALRAQLAARSVRTRPGRWSKDALHADRFDIRGDRAFVAGHFEVQDEGSQLIALAVGARPGHAVLDLCAGAGGKTLALADHMQGQGRLVASDVDPARLGDLRGRLRQRDLGWVEVRDLRSQHAPGGMDRVLVDAPCSSVGTWRRGPDRKWGLARAEVGPLTRLQRALLARGADRVRRGGRLVYATCSLLRAENEDVAAAFQAHHPGFEPSPCLPETFGDSATVELRPDLHGTDGFFIAAWTRRE